MSRQRLGQHFLHDLGWRKRILATLPLAANQTWIEIGPGHGEMTQLLVGEGRRIIAIETDQRLAEGLRAARDNDTAQWPGLEIVTADVLATNIGDLATSTIHVYGNLPYYITSPILHHLFAFAPIIDEIHIVIQLEVAERLAAEPGSRDYGYLSVATQLYSRPEIVLKIPREAFDPPPEVASALVTLRLPGQEAKLGGINREEFLDFVKACFAQKRKTLVNNLKTVGKADVIRAALEKCGLRADARAEQLNIAEFAAVARELKVEKTG